MENFNFTVAKNLTSLRKKNKLTQAELAEKLNYSDKAVSKWEQGESLPGIEVLYKLSRLYGVSLDYMVGESNGKTRPAPLGIVQKRRNIITLLSVIAVWLVATVLYTLFNVTTGKSYWQFFCWAVPVSLAVAIVFDAMWHRRRFLFVIISALIWTLLLCFCLQFVSYNIWIILGIGVPLQAAALLCARMVK